MFRLTFIVFFLLSALRIHAQYAPKREFRGVWIATVNNIDYPSRRDLTPKQQRTEYTKILDTLRQKGINAVMMQIRPAADAFYAKSREPWSVWLTGKQGEAPKPAYDPLDFMIKSAHKHSMEFHAWFNPYRASTDTNFSALSPDHITRKHPEWFLVYDKKKLFNPGLPEVRKYVVQVIMDVVRNYDIDGVHFDDYFYPYTVLNDTLQDDQTFRDFPNGFTDKNDWRRNNVTLLIRMLSDSIRQTKPYIKFGVSPFGVWKNKSESAEGSDTQAGQTTFTNLYADIRLWLKEGWIDYVVPQVYFSNRHSKVNYEKLTDWWAKNSYGKHLYIGQGSYKIAKDRDSAWFNPMQTGQQLRFNRQIPQIQGSVFFSCKTILRNPLGFADSLQRDFYKNPALLPLMSWKNANPPEAPTKLKVKYKSRKVKLRWITTEATTKYFGVYRFTEGSSENLLTVQVANNKRRQKFIDKTASRKNRFHYGISALDRLQNESEIVKK
jgi:uncharacterized lipoprotein YddW (UPF0748 family)